MGQLFSGAERLAGGTGKYMIGVGQAADGAAQLAAGLLRLDAGSRGLPQGFGAFHDKPSEAGSKLPNCSDSDRDMLSQTVAFPVLKDGKVYETMMAPLTALLAMVTLWLGSPLSWSLVRSVPSDLIASFCTSATPWLRTLWPPAAFGAVQGLLFGVVAGMALGLAPRRTISMAALLTMVGMGSVVVSHALIGWFGNVGHGIPALAPVVAVALGPIPTTLGWAQRVAGILPLHNGLLLVCTFLASGSGLVVLSETTLLFGVIAVGLSYLAIASCRRLTADQFRSCVMEVMGVQPGLGRFCDLIRSPATQHSRSGSWVPSGTQVATTTLWGSTTECPQATKGRQTSEWNGAIWNAMWAVALAPATGLGWLLVRKTGGTATRRLPAVSHGSERCRNLPIAGPTTLTGIHVGLTR